ncbi:MAG: hypothetical protein IKX93_05645 [Bacteroidaceae bacterium]|nr:hypothetical protein [Prevotella sp.]MBR5764085.1 hypothetical protein [Bacteroidaceae bacterium]
MKHSILLFLLALCTSVQAQIPAGRSKGVTMFSDFQPAIIKLKDGKSSVHKQTNIFLKNSTLVYKKVPTGEIMEASMPVVAGITVGDRNFINVKNHLAEVVATEGDASLVRVRVIDVETMKGEYLNNSTITNSSMLDDLSAGRLIGESMSTTRIDGAEDEEPYPLMDTYYYVVGDKVTLAHERSIKSAIKKDQRHEYEVILSNGFSWTRQEDLAKLLKLFK